VLTGLDRFERVLQLLPEPSFLINGDGTVLSVNAAAAEHVALAPGALRGSSIYSLVTDPQEKVASLLRLAARSRQLLPGQLHWRSGEQGDKGARCDVAVLQPRSADSPAVILLRCRPRAETPDQFAVLNEKIMALSREVMERKRAEAERDQLLQSERLARLEAEHGSRMKDEFLATLSHELRTPLNAILGWAQLLRARPSPVEDLRQGLETIERNSRLQAQLIEDLLDMSRIISGKVRLEVQAVDLARVVMAAIDTVSPAAEAKQIRLQPMLDPDSGPVMGDPSRLQQVIWNLLSNAVKFTPRHGRVQVLLQRVNSHVEIVVTDSGEGIAPEFLPYVFERFRQAEGSTTRRHGGLGLGLSIVKHLIELHGGTVRAYSAGRGTGATFTVALPLSSVHEASSISSRHPRAALDPPVDLEVPSLRGLTVLVVDDEPDAHTLLRKILTQYEAQVIEVDSAEGALAALKKAVPDVIISDVGLPDEDGYSLIRRIRSLPEPVRRVPAVALSAFARMEDRQRALLSGFQMHLAKPIAPAELITVVASLAGRT